MIVIVRNRTTGSTETFLNAERIESNSKDDGASAFNITLTDRSKHYYPEHLYSYEAVDRLSRGRHKGKTEEWKKLREAILGSTENKQEPFFNGYIPNFYFKQKEKTNDN